MGMALPSKSHKLKSQGIVALLRTQEGDDWYLKTVYNLISISTYTFLALFSLFVECHGVSVCVLVFSHLVCK